jgi:competence protein ComEA
VLEGLSRNQIVGWVAALAVVVVLGGRYLKQPGGAEPAAASGSPPAVRVERPPSSGAAVVHVAGAVRRPGVYRMRPGSRIDDAVRRAGGPTRRADLSAVNLAAKVEDGRQVLVPPKAAAGAVSPASGGAGGATVPVNLNTATAEQLDTLDGVGPATVQKILDHRQQHGGFGRVDELAQIPGIGPKRLAALREQVTV